MKKVAVLLTLFIVLFTNVSCGGDDSDNTTTDSQEVFKVDFDGETYIAETVSASIINGLINITGFGDTNNEFISLTINAEEVGTYQLGVPFGNPASVHGIVYNEGINTNISWLSAAQGISPTSQGEVVISEINETDKTISGTFFFTGTKSGSIETKEFTNGIFTNIPYVTELGGSTNNNTFFAKVDGEEFVETAINGNITTVFNTSILNIIANNANTETIGLALPVDITAGNYTFSLLSQPRAFYNLSVTNSNSGDGNLTITSHDTSNKIIEGTFDFLASPVLGTTTQYYITEGAFYVEY